MSDIKRTVSQTADFIKIALGDKWCCEVQNQIQRFGELQASEWRRSLRRRPLCREIFHGQGEELCNVVRQKSALREPLQGEGIRLPGQGEFG